MNKTTLDKQAVRQNANNRSLRRQYTNNLRWAFRAGAICCLGFVLVWHDHVLAGILAVVVSPLLAKPRKLLLPEEEYWGA